MCVEVYMGVEVLSALSPSGRLEAEEEEEEEAMAVEEAEHAVEGASAATVVAEHAAAAATVVAEHAAAAATAAVMATIEYM